MEGCWSLSNINHLVPTGFPTPPQVFQIHYYNPSTDTVTIPQNVHSTRKESVDIALPFYEGKNKYERRCLPCIFVPTEFAKSLIRTPPSISQPKFRQQLYISTPPTNVPTEYMPPPTEDTSKGPFTAAWPHEKSFKKPFLNIVNQNISSPQLFAIDGEVGGRQMLANNTINQGILNYQDAHQFSRRSNEMQDSQYHISNFQDNENLSSRASGKGKSSSSKNTYPSTEQKTSFEIRKNKCSETHTLLPELLLEDRLPKTQKFQSLFEIVEENKVYPINSFMRHYWRVYPSHTPVDFYKESDRQFRTLSLKIWQRYLLHQPQIKTYSSKISIWTQLQILLDQRKADSLYNLFMTGSTLSGLAISSSDMDICMKSQNEREFVERHNEIYHLECIKRLLQTMKEVDNLSLIDAKVPLLKFKILVDHPIEINVSCNNLVAVANTQLLFSYARCDWRFQPLSSIIKQWAIHNDLNDPLKKTLSSYTLSLLVVQFLQNGISPPVLPCLHNCIEDLSWEGIVKKSQLEIFKQWLVDWRSDNAMSLGELLLEFFKFYCRLDFVKHVISVRIGKPVLRDVYEISRGDFKFNEKEFVFVEEPFTLTNTAYAVHCPVAFQTIREALSAALKTLKNTIKLEKLFESEIDSDV